MLNMQKYSRLIFVAILALVGGIIIYIRYVPHIKIITSTQYIPYKVDIGLDNCLSKGQTSVSEKGVNGVNTISFKVTYLNGKETSKQQISVVTTTNPTNELLDVGTKVSSNYPCIPNATSAGGYTNVNQNAVNGALNTIVNPPPVSTQ